MAKKKRKASAQCATAHQPSPIARRVRQALGLSVALACSAPLAAADESLIARAFADHASYLAREALSYEHGEGVPRDQPYAARLYCESARLGDPEGMYALGWMYANGRGVERNDDYAASFFEMAAKKGNEHAARMQRYIGESTGALPDCMETPSTLIVQRWPIEALVARLPPARQQVARMLSELAPKYGIHPQFALAIGLTESALNPQAVSPKNAMGVMQLIPETAERFNVGNVYDPEQNIRGGLAYLRWLLAYFEGDIALAAAGYNAGEGAVDRHRGVPPYRETRAYVERILRHVGQARHPYDSSVVSPSRMLRTLRLASQEDHET
ncbi:MAG: transglycosylase SLT domain-containing protein [Thauera sp.]|nr:transglycosylase SLT domain-containing protein [Thauera sp.]MBP7467354.1 transglycosylase SLT domain-containing protein [Thauera sp.]HQV08825.1 transglycosylase SLT domain-containing protein [Thauera sp.]